MTSYINQWGYSTSVELPSLISVQDFETATGGEMSSSTEQIQATLDAASGAIRSFCGWHVAPNLRCAWQGDADGRLIQLPAMNVTSIHSVTIDGVELAASDYSWRASGLIRLAKPIQDDWGRRVIVEFDAGCDSGALNGVVTQVAVNNLVAPAGVMREQVSDVSITYNQLANGVTGGIRLISGDKAMLKAFKLPTMG
jgi:hypothetical protein